MFVKHKGITLVELVMAISLAGIMIVGLMSAYASIAGRSSDPLVRTQAITLAESYLEEALLKPFLDPIDLIRCPASPGGNRENFDNVCDYNNYSSANISLPNGTQITALSGYSVSITVVDSTDLTGISSNCALKVTVNVTSPLNETISVSGYRANYASPGCT